jgi:hypothetical protein
LGAKLLVVVLLPVSLEGLRQLYLAGTFPINGSDGWQGGQVYLIVQSPNLRTNSQLGPGPGP